MVGQAGAGRGCSSERTTDKRSPSGVASNRLTPARASQGALTGSERLTPLGQMLSRLPVDVTVGKMLVLGSALRQMGPTLSAAAALSVQSPLTNRAFRDPDCLVSDPPPPQIRSSGDSLPH